MILFSIRNKAVRIPYLSYASQYLKIETAGQWYPSIGFAIYRQNQKNGKYVFLHNVSVPFIHKSGNIIYSTHGSDKDTLDHFRRLKSWFNGFKFYMVVSPPVKGNALDKGLSLDEIAEPWEQEGWETFKCERHIKANVIPWMDSLPKRFINVGLQGNHFSIDLKGGFQVTNKDFMNYYDPIKMSRDFKNYQKSLQNVANLVK